jgi:hypothetical protein
MGIRDGEPCNSLRLLRLAGGVMTMCSADLRLNQSFTAAGYLKANGKQAPLPMGTPPTARRPHPSTCIQGPGDEQPQGDVLERREPVPAARP